MLKNKPFKACLLISAIVICFSFNDVSAEPCKAPDCPRGFSTIQGTVEYPEGWYLEWENAPPAMMDQGTNSGISVKGKWVDANLNLKWTISGTNFSFNQNDLVQYVETNADHLTLYAKSDACGMAIIIVEDVVGNTVTGYVRSNSGVWQVCNEELGCGTSGMLSYSYSKIINPYRIRWSESRYWNSACYDVTATCSGFSYTQEPRVWDSSGNNCRCIRSVTIDEWVCP